MEKQLKSQTKAQVSDWWKEEYGFFGQFYIQGDNSTKGYLIEKKQTLDQRTIAEVDGVVNLLDLAGNARVLDCPCGYGRHSIELIKRGFQVVGSDLNSIHLSRAIETAKEINIKSDFKKESMLDLTYINEFDAVINMFYSFGFFETDEENFKVLKNFYNALVPGGQFLMHTDVNLPRVFNNKYREIEERKLTGGDYLRIIDNYNSETKRIDGKWIIKNNKGEEAEKSYSVRVYSRQEFEDWCREAGFRKVTTYSEWSGQSYSDDSEDMIVVATK